MFKYDRSSQQCKGYRYRWGEFYELSGLGSLTVT